MGPGGLDLRPHPALGAREDLRDVVASREDCDVPVRVGRLHDGVLGEQRPQRLESAGVAVRVVARHEVSDSFSGEKVIERHHRQP